MIQYNKNFDADSNIHFVFYPQNNPARGQTQLCHNLIVNLFKKGISSCKQKIAEVETGDKSFVTIYQASVKSFHIMELFTIEFLPSQANQTPDQKQTDDIDVTFSKKFTE